MEKICICLYFFLTQKIASFSEESKGSCQILQVAEHCVTSSFNDIYRLQWLTAKLLHKPAVSITCKWNRHQNNLMEKKPHCQFVCFNPILHPCVLPISFLVSLCFFVSEDFVSSSVFGSASVDFLSFLLLGIRFY